MKWLIAVLLMGCETNEVRAWAARRSALEQRQAELTRLEETGPRPRIAQLRTALDLAGFVRARHLIARVFMDPGAVRLTASGTVQECRDTVNALAELRWVTQDWRLRLEKGHCEWEARTGADYATLEQALSAPDLKWTAPPSQVFSADLSALKRSVETLNADVRAREARLGDFAVLEARVEGVQPLMDSLARQPAPCDLAVLDRELALSEAEQGALLEVERSRLVHPLEPRADFRLRGLAEFSASVLTWHCEPL